MAENYTDTGVEEAPSPELDYHALNAQLNLYDAEGRIHRHGRQLEQRTRTARRQKYHWDATKVPQREATP